MTKIYKKFKKLIEKNESSWINLAILSIIALFVKQYCTHVTYKNLSIYWFKFYLNSFCTDLIVILIILCLTTTNHFIKNRRIKTINNIVSFLIFIIFCIDIFTIYFLQNRVAIPEAFQYITNGWNWFTDKVLITISVIILIWIISLYFTTRIKKDSKITKNILVSIILILMWISFIFGTSKNITNIISLNINYIKDKLNTQKEFNLWETLHENINENINENNNENNNEIKEYKDYIKHIKWDWKDLNIILVFAESISAIDSANMWWYDNMTWFDKIQNDWIKFENFIENWATSDTAHISTLLWIMPLENIAQYSGYKTIMEPLPEFLNKQWYMTTFISTASLKFLNQRTFLSWAWFQKIIWEEEFTNKKKYAFDSASDKDLYDRVLKEIKTQTWKYFIWLQTISFHKPYNTPNWKTEKTALEYCDQELYNFYLSLKEIWFFDNWILIILWDHRKMEPAEEWEYDLIWRNRYTRPVATIVWSGVKKWVTNKNIIQHTDFYNSIKRKVWKWIVEIDSNYNDIFQKSINRNRWMTSIVHSENKYVISYIDKKWYTFNDISTLQKDDIKLYNYLTNYFVFEFSNNSKKINESNLIFIWHKWASNYAQENSIISFMKSKNQWADWIEFDVSYTKDKENIVAHWEYLDVSNCSGEKIQDHDFNRITKNCTLNNWEKYRTLKEMLELIDWLFDYYFLEIKVYDKSLWEEQTLKAIETVKELNMQDRIIFISYSDIARKILNDDPDIIFWRDTFNINDLDIIWNNNSKYFLAPYEILTPEAIQKAQELWKEVVTYTVNNTWTFQEMKELWVNIILTDEIQLLKNYENTIKE